MATFFEPYPTFGLAGLHDRVDSLFGDLFRAPVVNFFPDRRSAYVAPMDMTGDENGYVLTVEVPGIAPEDVKVQVLGNVLTVTGEKKAMKDGEARIAERAYGAFMRTMNLPEDADPDGVAAVTDNGLLRVSIPRKEGKEARDIEVTRS